MNPGVWIMGGGGSGGGSGRDGRGGNGGEQGANGENGGDEAQGGGKNAGACGAGSGGGCPNPAHGGNGGTHAGDPVDPMTGRVYTIPQTDLALTGAFAFRIERSYSSAAAERDIGLGFGWSTSISWEIEVRRRTLLVHRPNGTTSVRNLPAVGGSCWVGDGVRLTRDSGGFLISEGRLIYVFRGGELDPSRWLLSSVVDRSGNRITLTYKRDVLVQLTDTINRTIHVRRHGDGRVRAFELETRSGSRVSYRTYEYDARGDLVATIDAIGRRIAYVYEEHRLTKVIYPSGLTTHYRYDANGRCVETWCDYGGAPDPSLYEGAPKMLADGLTPARGVLHVALEYGPDFTMVYDSRHGRRLDRGPGGKVALASGVWTESLDYDALGNVAAHRRANGATTRYGRDREGRIVSVIDATGAETRNEYDEAGNLAEVVDALGTSVAYSYDDAHNLLEARDTLGLLLSFTYDPAGRRRSAVMPDGAVTSFEYDADQNLAKLTEPNGKSRAFRHDDVGRLLSFRDEEGHETSFHYDECGALLGATLPNGARCSIELDVDGRLHRYIGSDGGTYEFLWGGYNVVHELRKPNGDRLQFRYDREGSLVEVVNEAGERYRCHRDLAGRISAEEHFDGRRYDYTLDGDGRIRQMKNSLGERILLEHDAAGRIVRRTYGGDTFEAFEYDLVGRLIASETPTTRCEYEYDQRGNLTRETQIAGAWRVEVISTYDAASRRTSVTTSSGYDVTVQRDGMGLPSTIDLGRGECIKIERDGIGREIVRTLSSSCHVITRYDSVGLVAERRVIGQSASQVPAGAPAWVGMLPPGTVLQEWFAYTPSGELAEHVDSTGAGAAFAYDRLRRVTERRPKAGAPERFTYGPGGRAQPDLDGVSARTFGAGGVVLTDKDRAFVYDAEGRRVRSAHKESGAETVSSWSARSTLEAQRLQDGTRVEHVYDAHARRLMKRVTHPDGAATITHFVWSGDQMIQEIRERYDRGERVMCQRVDYVYHDDAVSPLAHRETGAGADGGWVHYLLGPGCAPSILLSHAGEVLARAEVSLWGDVRFDSSSRADTPWGYGGMYRDKETALFYQRYRFYDPSLGQYLSPDPLGIAASLNAWEYVYSQPLRLIDPLGLKPVTCEVTGTAGPNGSVHTSTGESGGEVPFIHPVVAAAMPPRHPDDATGVYPRGNTQSPTACAEPRALSGYLKEWEKNHNNGVELDPNNKEDHAKIQQALGSIGSFRASDDKGGRAPCPNCSQLIANLYNKYGAPNPNAPNKYPRPGEEGTTLVTPGSTSRGGSDNTNFSPPDEKWVNAQRESPGRSGMPPFGPRDPNQQRDKTGPAYGPWDSYDQAGAAGARGDRTR